MIKVGQYIGMGNKEVSLLVEVQNINGHMMSGWVVNGCWEFKYSMLTSRMEFDPPSGHSSFRAHVLFTESYPKQLHHYNDIMDYMNEYLMSKWYTRVLSHTQVVGSAMVTLIKEAPTRFVNSIRGMRTGWSAPLAVSKKARLCDDDPFDDEIPF